MIIVTVFTSKDTSTGRLIKLSDRGKSLKFREGSKPLNMKSSFSFEIEGKINKAWKNRLSDKIDKYLQPLFKVKSLNIADNAIIYSISCNSSNARDIANLAANYILLKQKPLQIDNPNFQKKIFNQYLNTII